MPESKKSRTPGQERLASRRRNWASIVYPESAPEGWTDKLAEMHIPALVSPLHDLDKKEDGELKKPHYHVLLMFESVQARDQVVPIISEIGGVGLESIGNARAYSRYLCHMDNPEKVQYAPDDVMQFGGADYRTISHVNADDRKVLLEIFGFIRENQILSFAELLDVTAITNPEMFDLVTMSKAYIVQAYLKSLAWENEHGYTRQVQTVDPETGEIKIKKGCGEDG